EGTSVRSAEEDAFDPDNTAAGSFTQMWSRYIIDTEDWSGEVARLEVPLGDLANARLTRAFVEALAAARHRDASRTRTEHAALAEGQRELTTGLANRPQTEQSVRRAAVLEQEIAAAALFVDGRTAEAIAALRRTVESEHAMPVEFGPPFVDKPAAELLGD